MTDPNMPPRLDQTGQPPAGPTDQGQVPSAAPAQPTHTTVNVTSEPRGGGGGGSMALIIGAIVVVLAIVAFLVFARGREAEAPAEPRDVNIDVNLPDIPAPKMPDMPSLPAPENLPTPGPTPAN